MNSTLPNFLAAPAAAPSGASQLNATALAGLLSAPAGHPGGEPPAGLPADFSTLMPAASATAPAASAPVITVSPLLPAQPPVVNLATPVPGAPAVVATPTAPVIVTAPAPNRRFTTTTTSATSAKPLTAEPAPNDATIQLPSWNRGTPAPVGVDSSETPDRPLTDLATTPAEVPQEIREQAVAFVATLIQSLLPEAQIPAASAAPARTTGSLTPNSPPAPMLSPGLNRLPAPLARAPLTIDPPAAMLAPGTHSAPAPHDPLVLPVSVPNPPPAALASPVLGTASNEPPADDTLRPLVAAAQPALAPSSTSAPGPSFVVAADGALEFKLTLSSAAPLSTAPLAASAFPAPADLPVEFQAELTVTGQPPVRVESAGFTAAPTVTAALAATLPAPQENFAAKNPAKKSASDSRIGASERNFEFTGGKQVAPASSEAGITVAQTEATMTAAPTEEPRAARRTPEPTVLPARAEFQVAQAPAERITAPAPGPSGPSFAERAVDTVTGLIEAQFAASMQKSGSVQLRLKFGGEDLSVRVEIRDGAVHADFRTDSAPLRAALEREWQAVVAAAPGQMQRYVEPVFSTGSPASAHSYSAHGDARQQHQQQADAEAHQRQARESFSDHPAFNRRSLVGESFVPEPPAPRVAAFLPTSLRLSALA